MTQLPLPLPVLLEEGACVPVYATAGAAGADLFAFIEEPLAIEPGRMVMVPTGIRVAIPSGYELQIRPRSGLAAKSSIGVLNSPGTIDEDYRGEIKVLLFNHGTSIFYVEPNMRIAQAVLAPIVRAHFVCVEELSATSRGEGGFGSTGSGKKGLSHV